MSALDYANAVTVAGTTVPGTTIRKVETEVELASGQTFVIAGLLDRQTTEILSKVPGIGDIPVLGKLFQSKSLTRSDSELLVIITPEIVEPLGPKDHVPEISFPEAFLPPLHSDITQSPAGSGSGASTSPPARETIPVEELMDFPKQPRNLGVADHAPGIPNNPAANPQARH